MKRSFIREILEHTTNDTISFAGGLPDEKLFPVSKLKASLENVIDDIHSLQYGTTMGYGPLREKIASMYTKDGFVTDMENILITSGAQQALDIIARYHMNSNITIEAPSYLGAMNIFDLNNIQQDSVALGDDGVDIDAFGKSFERSKLAYIIPDYQNPTGHTYSSDKRVEIAKTIKTHGGLLIEDAPYSELYFESKKRSISSLLPTQSYHVGSFSKVLAPGLRLGWIRADKELISPLVAYKEATDLHNNGLTQRLLDNYLDDNNSYTEHVNNLRKVYKEKMMFFTKSLSGLLPEFEYVAPQGGMFIYGKLSNVNTSQLVQICLEKGVLFVPGMEFYLSDGPTEELRLNYTNTDPDQVEKGLYILAETYRSMQR